LVETELAAFVEMNFEHFHLVNYLACFISNSPNGHYIYDIVSEQCDANLVHYLAKPEKFGQQIFEIFLRQNQNFPQK